MRIILISIMMIVAFPLLSFAGSSDRYESTTDVKKLAWMDKGKSAVLTKLKDPSSAKFRNVFFNRGADNVPMTCGEVNSKNSYGGYSGYQRFISGGKPGMTFLQEEVSDFHKLWTRFCQ